MADIEEKKDTEEKEVPKFRGLYRHVHISVKALDAIIATCIIVIIVVTLVSLPSRGYMVNFDAKGGTDVESVKYQYGELVVEPTPPTREGYVFIGWFKDPNCTEPWSIETDKVVAPITLYAGWEKK